jgi:hypothetical protein
LDTVEALLANEAIQQLRARFARCMDSKDWAGMRATLADDCVFDAGQEANVDSLWVGADVIVANISGSFAHGESVHHAHMPEIELTSPTTARGIWAMRDRLRWPGSPPLQLNGSGHYHETYECQGGQWRIKTFKLLRLRVEMTP